MRGDRRLRNPLAFHSPFRPISASGVLHTLSFSNICRSGITLSSISHQWNKKNNSQG